MANKPRWMHHSIKPQAPGAYLVSPTQTELRELTIIGNVMFYSYWDGYRWSVPVVVRGNAVVRYGTCSSTKTRFWKKLNAPHCVL